MLTTVQEKKKQSIQFYLLKRSPKLILTERRTKIKKQRKNWWFESIEFIIMFTVFLATFAYLLSGKFCFCKIKFHSTWSFSSCVFWDFQLFLHDVIFNFPLSFTNNFNLFVYARKVYQNSLLFWYFFFVFSNKKMSKININQFSLPMSNSCREDCMIVPWINQFWWQDKNIISRNQGQFSYNSSNLPNLFKKFCASFFERTVIPVIYVGEHFWETIEASGLRRIAKLMTNKFT